MWLHYAIKGSESKKPSSAKPRKVSREHIDTSTNLKLCAEMQDRGNRT